MYIFLTALGYSALVGILGLYVYSISVPQNEQELPPKPAENTEEPLPPMVGLARQIESDLYTKPQEICDHIKDSFKYQTYFINKDLTELTDTQKLQLNQPFRDEVTYYWWDGNDCYVGSKMENKPKKSKKKSVKSKKKTAKKKSKSKSK